MKILERPNKGRLREKSCTVRCKKELKAWKSHTNLDNFGIQGCTCVFNFSLHF